MNILSSILLNVNPFIGAVILYLLLVIAIICLVAAVRKSPGDKS
jgi:hypothetical protein